MWEKNLVPGQLFALARMLPIIFRGRTDEILGAYATKMVTILSPGTVCISPDLKSIANFSSLSLSGQQIPVNIWVIGISHDNSLTSLIGLFYIFKEYCINTMAGGP